MSFLQPFASLLRRSGDIVPADLAGQSGASLAVKVGPGSSLKQPHPPTAAAAADGIVVRRGRRDLESSLAASAKSAQVTLAAAAAPAQSSGSHSEGHTGSGLVSSATGASRERRYDDEDVLSDPTLDVCPGRDGLTVLSAATGSTPGGQGPTPQGVTSSTTLAVEAFQWLMRHIQSPEEVLHVVLPPERVALSATNGTSGREDESSASDDREIPLDGAGSNQALDSEAREWGLSYVSATPATREEVQQLQVELECTLIQLKAKEVGVCPIRNAVFRDLMNELIRQVLLDDVARGLLLVRVRDEYEHTLAAHKKLLQRSLSFGAKTMYFDRYRAPTRAPGLGPSRTTPQQLAHPTVQGTEVPEATSAASATQIADLQRLKRELAMQVKEESERLKTLKKIHQEQAEASAKRHGEEVAFFRKTNQQLSQLLKEETDKCNLGGGGNGSSSGGMSLLVSPATT